MATIRATNIAKRPIHDESDDEEGPVVSQRFRRLRKKTRTESTTEDVESTEPDGRRDSLRDPDDSGNDALEEDEDDGYHGPYSEEQEALPNHPAFDKQISAVREIVSKLAEEANASVSIGTCDTARMTELRSMAQKTLVIPELEPQMIGLIGEAGQGKSSLVNSLCNCPNLAKALDAGKSCTYVITKYERAGPDQKLKFSSKVEFYDSLMIAVILSKALDDWHTFYQEADDTWTTAEIEEHESKASTCLSTFRSIYSGYSEFRTDESATTTLHEFSRKKCDRDQVLQRLVSRAEDVLRSVKQADGRYVHYHEADSTEDLWKNLNLFVTEGTDPDEPTAWPLVKQVSVGVKGSRVLEYYVLVDMPGISDTNELRVDATQQFIKKCDHIMVVARAGRVTTDPVVRSMLRKYGKVPGCNVMVVSTKSDENIEHPVAIEMDLLGFSIGDYHTLKGTSDALVSKVKVLERGKKKFPRGSVERNALEGQISEVQQRKQLVENSRWELIVAARNAHNADRLRTATANRGNLSDGKELHVFSVSNKQYENLLVDEVSGDFQLSPEGTGVPGLRKHLLLLAAPRILRVLQDFVSSQMSTIIPSFDMWARAGKLNNDRAAVIDVVKEQQQRLLLCVEKHPAIVMGLVDELVISALKSKQDTCAESAIQYVQETLRKLFYQTLRAFVQRNGKHQTSVASGSWNEQFTTESKNVIDKSWPTLIRDREAKVNFLEGTCTAVVYAITKSLRTRSFFGVFWATMKGRGGVSEPEPATVPFEQALGGHLNGMRQIMRRYDQAMLKELRTIYINATVDGADMYFTKAMQEAYEICRNDSGPGVKARTLNTFITHLALAADRSPWAMMAVALFKDIQDAENAQVPIIHAELDIHFQAILHDVKSLVLETPQDPSEVQVRQAVLDFVETANPKLDRVKEMLLAIESRYLSETFA